MNKNTASNCLQAANMIVTKMESILVNWYPEMKKPKKRFQKWHGNHGICVSCTLRNQKFVTKLYCANILL